MHSATRDVLPRAVHGDRPAQPRRALAIIDQHIGDREGCPAPCQGPFNSAAHLSLWPSLGSVMAAPSGAWKSKTAAASRAALGGGPPSAPKRSESTLRPAIEAAAGATKQSIDERLLFVAQVLIGYTVQVQVRSVAESLRPQVSAPVSFVGAPEQGMHEQGQASPQPTCLTARGIGTAANLAPLTLVCRPRLVKCGMEFSTRYVLWTTTLM